MSDRLPISPSEIINRSRKITFRYKNQTISAFEGETVAVALLNAGVKVFGRSFKYHRPRGPHCLSGQCSRCSMIVDGRPNIRTCHTPVREGMIVNPQGKTDLDPMALAGKAVKMMPTGFYHKYFYKPAWIWPLALKNIRKAPGGHGEVSIAPVSSGFEMINLTPDLLVIGGGLAGLEAALVGAKEGIRVVLVETESRLGGFELFQGDSRQQEVNKLATEIRKHENVTVLTSTTVMAFYPENRVLCTETYSDPKLPEKSYLIDPRSTVIATGVVSRPMIFSNNDRPGIITPEAAQRLVHLYGMAPGKKVFLAGGDDYLIQTGLDLAAKGIEIAGIADYRSEVPVNNIHVDLAQTEIPVFKGYTVNSAIGNKSLKAIEIKEIRSSKVKKINADCLIGYGGRSTRHKLLALTGAKIVYRPDLNLHLAESLPPGYHGAGRVMGFDDREAISFHGRLSAGMALAEIGIDTKSVVSEAKQQLADYADLNSAVAQPGLDQADKKAFVCFCGDTNIKDIDGALAAGFENAESIKRFTTATMGPCQGGMCQDNFLSVLAMKRPDKMKDQIPMTPRPSVAPFSLGSLASAHHTALKYTPLYRVQQESGGSPTRAGVWERFEHFGDLEKEIAAIHNNAGLLDVSTLGKFRLYGPDAAKLWNRINTNSIDKIKKQQLRYTATCNEEGVLIDDGVTIKRGENEYYFTTSTGRSLVTVRWYTRWCREENLDVNIVDVTNKYAAMNLTGPKARDILATLTDANVENKAFPYMHWADMKIAGVDCTVFRMGFLGELSYEIHCPASEAYHLWRKILENGSEHGIRPAGIEALLACRLEKGHILPGMDTNGYTTLFDANFGWLWDKSKEDMVGGAILKLIKDQPSKLNVIGFKMEGNTNIKEGYLVVDSNETQLGDVTSVMYSSILDQTIGLALVKPIPEFKDGAPLTLLGEGRKVTAIYHKPPFYDPEGKRMKS